MNVILHSQNLQQKTEENQTNNSNLLVIVDDSEPIYKEQLQKLSDPLEIYEFERENRLKDNVWLFKRLIGLILPKQGYIITVEPYYT